LIEGREQAELSQETGCRGRDSANNSLVEPPDPSQRFIQTTVERFLIVLIADGRAPLQQAKSILDEPQQRVGCRGSRNGSSWHAL